MRNIFFQISKDGRVVSVAKTFKKEIDEKTFKEKSVSISTGKFLEIIPKEMVGKIQHAILTIKKICEKKLSMIGTITKNNDSGYERTYYIGNCVFVEKNGLRNNDIDQRECAINHGELVYGAEFMKSNMSMFNDGKMHYLSDKTEISKDEYNSYMKCIEELTQIVCVQKTKKLIQ